MGFLDSFFTGVGSFLTSPIGTAIGQLGVAKLADVIGLTPTGASGSPRSGMAPFSPLGTPVTPFLTAQQQAEMALRRAEEQAFLFSQSQGVLRPALGPQVFRPGFAAPLPSIPSSQPFGVQPGTGLVPLPPGGFNVAAFPTTVQASFPSSPFTTGNPFFQTAGFPALGALGGALARQIPGLLGGVAAGSLIGAGGGGGGTPPFRATMAGARAQFFRTENPATGQDTWFRPAGRPLLWSGDLTACKRVNKIARRAKRKR